MMRSVEYKMKTGCAFLMDKSATTYLWISEPSGVFILDKTSLLFGA